MGMGTFFVIGTLPVLTPARPLRGERQDVQTKANPSERVTRDRRI
jgi:hypothetical protein